jgi:hypothetical protein
MTTPVGARATRMLKVARRDIVMSAESSKAASDDRIRGHAEQSVSRAAPSQRKRMDYLRRRPRYDLVLSNLHKVYAVTLREAW